MKDLSSRTKKIALLLITILLSLPFVKHSAAQCTDNYEPNDTRKQASQIQTNTGYHALINTSLDIDWFRFPVTADEPNVLIILSELSENYNLYLFDDTTKAKIGSSKNRKLEPDTIVMNGLVHGKYCVKVRAKAGRFDADSCYSLIVNTSALPYREAEVADYFVNERSQFELYPNPTSDKLIVQFDNNVSSLRFSIYNLMGQEISEIQDAQLDENQNAEIDVSALSAGEYFLRIKYDTGIEVKKFIVSK